MALKDLPAQAQPRERLAAHGPSALSDIELLAIVLRTGMAGKGVLQLAQELLQLPGRPGLSGLLQAGHADLKAIKGLGPSKCAQLLAVLELARRATAEQLRERPALASPEAVARYLQLHLAARQHEVFAVLFLDSQHRLIALEEMFRGTLTRTPASTPGKWCCAPCTTTRVPSSWPTTTPAAMSRPALRTGPSRRACRLPWA